MAAVGETDRPLRSGSDLLCETRANVSVRLETLHKGDLQSLPKADTRGFSQISWLLTYWTSPNMSRN
jgi:hypothetical protein